MRFGWRPRVASHAIGLASGTARSRASGPAIALSTIMQSCAWRHIGPILSSVLPAVITPARLTRPKVGRSPTIPHRTAGDRIEPPVSVPIANATRPAAVAAAEPADDPLDPCSRFHGLLVRPPAH